MAPLGRRICRFPNKIDGHFIDAKNWWEECSPQENKGRDRQLGKKFIEEELDVLAEEYVWEDS